MSVPPQTIVRTYKGREAAAMKAFQGDAAKLSSQRYHPTAQTWAPGSYGCGDFLGALLLCLILIGFIIFIYMLLVKPQGTLTVTYEYRPAPTIVDEKTCPRCAEKVKAAAAVCRFCGHEFINSAPST